jgi:hypothetical protein
MYELLSRTRSGVRCFILYIIENWFIAVDLHVCRVQFVTFI